jgi:AAA family ATP:ADP antiporter
MRKNILYRILSRIVDIRPGEEKLVLLLFTCFFLITSPHTIIKALRYADLLVKMGPGGLPIAYMAAAIVTGLVVVLHSRTHLRVSNQILITASLAFFSISGLILHLILLTNYGKTSAFISYFYWVWASVLTVVFLTHFWMIVNQVFNPREAKRLIGFCGSGGILGGIAGGLLAGFLTKANLSNLLLPLACVLLFTGIFVVRAIFIQWQKRLPATEQAVSKKGLPKTSKVGFRESFQTVAKSKYLRLISGLVVVTVIVGTFIDFQFSSAVDDFFRLGYVQRKEAMQSFFGLFSAGLLIFSFLLNLFLTSKILRNFGMRFTLLLTPAVLLVCSMGIVFASSFTLLLAVFIKGSDEGLSFSLQQSVREILYIPVASDLKTKVKPFIDMFINRFAKVFAAILLFIIAILMKQKMEQFITPVLDVNFSKDLIWGILVLLVIWIIIGFRISREYLGTIRENIKIKWGRADKDIAEKLDVDYTKLVFDTIESKDRSSVLYALHLFDLLEKDKLTPEIKEMISQKSSEVKASSLGEMFNAEGATWFPDIEDDISQENLITDIREVMSSKDYQQVMQRHADEVLDKSKKSEIERMELAKAIGLMDKDALLAGKLKKLINDDSPDVACYALRSSARLKKVEHIPAIISRLDNPKTHEDAVCTLIAYGQLAMSILDEYLADSKKAIGLRKAVVKVLGNIGSEEAVKVLLKELDRKPDELETEIIDALDRIHSEKEDIQFPPRMAKRATLSIIKEYCQTFIDLQQLDLDEKKETQRHHMERDLEKHLRDIFKLLGFLYPREDMVKAFQNIQAGTKHSIAYGIELLDNSLKKDMKDFILPLVEDLSPMEKQKKFQKILRNLGRI